MNKTVLVLAASTYQLPAIKTAQRLGWRVITTDNIPSNPGHLLADSCYSVDTTDHTGVLEIARQEQIDGIISLGTDVAVTTAAYVAEALNLTGPTAYAAKVLTDKLAFRRFMQQAGLPTPHFFQIYATALPDATIFDEATWIIKPNRSSGSKGICVLNSVRAFNRYWQTAVSFSADGIALLEEYLPGSQHTCEGILQDSHIRFCLITDRDTARPPYTATTGHRVPTLLGSEVQSKLQVTIETVFRALGVTDTLFDCDFVADGESVIILEMTPRLGGNSLSSLIQETHHFDIVDYAVKQACGVPALLPTARIPNPAAVLLLGVEHQGTLHFNAGAIDALCQENWIRWLTLDYAIGHPVQPFINGQHRVGETLIVGENRQDLEQKATLLHTKLALTAQ